MLYVIFCKMFFAKGFFGFWVFVHRSTCLLIYYEIVHAVHIRKYMRIHIKSSAQK